MEKNWLIRTKHKQILGPVSKAKVIELLEKGSLAADDEVSTGSGYWFWVREKDLVDKYLYGDIPQTFNPISEAVDVLCATGGGEGTASINRMPSQPKNTGATDKQAQNLPESGELDYPSLDDFSDDDEREDVTLVGGIPSLKTSPNKNIPDQVEPEPGVDGKIPDADDLEYPDIEVASGISPTLQTKASEEPVLTLDTDQEITPSIFIKEDEDEVEAKIPEQNDLEYPDMGEEGPDEELAEAEEKAVVELDSKKRLPPKGQPQVKKTKSSKKVRKKKVVKTSSVPPRNDRYLFYILILIVFLIGAILFYYTKILNRGVPGLSKLEDLIVPKVHAQVLSPSFRKKKV